jgi:plasmid stabilization system protein ParE
MDERKIIWSVRAEKELLHILNFYIERNGNAKYSGKLLNRVEKLIDLLPAYPELGHLTENKFTRE